MTKHVGIRCTGKVQGVFFRASTKAKALDLSVSGWVKNEPDGSVLIHADGSEKAVNELIEWCHSGSEFATVENVQVWEEPEENSSGEFEIRR